VLLRFPLLQRLPLLWFAYASGQYTCVRKFVAHQRNSRLVESGPARHNRELEFGLPESASGRPAGQDAGTGVPVEQ